MAGTEVWLAVPVMIVLSIVQDVMSVQEFYKQPTNQSAVEGSTIVLRCIIKNRVGIVQWTRGGFGLGTKRDLPGFQRYTMIGTKGITESTDEYSLKIEELELEDDSHYSCQVSAMNDEPFIVSDVAYITVLIPPSRPMLSGTLIPVRLDTPTNVSCSVLNGRPKPKITWKKDDVTITDKLFEVATLQTDGKRVDVTGIVTITATAADAGKKIECGAWNGALKDQDPLWTQATLDVQYAPKIRMVHSNPDKTMKEFDNVEFKCSGEANPYEITWKWYIDEELIPDQTSNKYRIEKMPRKYHGSTIKCEATNSVGSTSVEHAMNILYGPLFKDKEPQHVPVDVGERAELRCEADGNPTAEVTWRRQGKYTVLHTSSTYVIPSVREGMFGVYTCTATVLGFNEISRDIYVTENGPPEIISDVTQYGEKDEQIMILCMSISSPKPIFIWSRNGEPIDYATSGRFSTSEEPLPYGGKSYLQIINAKEEDFGVYNCTVTNGKGMASLMITLEETDEMPVALMIAGGVGAAAVILFIGLAGYGYHRCRHSDNESYAETDSNTEIRKRDKNESPSEMTKSTLMDQWRQDYNYRYSADFDEVDAKGKNGQYVGDTERYGTMPTNYTNGHIYTDQNGDDLGPLNRFENSYSTGYIPSTFRSPSRTDFTSGRITANDLNSGRVSVNDFTTGRISANNLNSGRVSATDFTSGRISTEPLEPFRLPAADFTTTKLATNV
ncbi:irregular chiasm C-roughest protein-like [Ruditapes philippinarum]|uniref:irregular chiasm C-roughest protein-like n=1 Tax=Ruditapes philippinarum TaxID=129788 RepID=UPI00295BF3C7|nr:irregular chiasm C-roughest protein-like [Ruditapes philippinarum]